MRHALGSWLASIIGGALVILAFALVNGGYVYRMQCATTDGRVYTDWSWRIWAVVPYLLPPKLDGCETHSSTRVLLSKAGVWKLPDYPRPPWDQ